MPSVGTKRERLVATADVLTHQQGFHRTTLAGIAAESGVPLGNVYYYFRTKEALGEAMVERRLERNRQQRASWEAAPDPRQRIIAFIRAVGGERQALARYGCPVGTLTQELQKDGGPLGTAAAALLSDMLDWLEAQFRAMGEGRRSRAQAVTLLSAAQGASLLTHAFDDPAYIAAETKRLEQWVRSL